MSGQTALIPILTDKKYHKKTRLNASLMVKTKAMLETIVEIERTSFFGSDTDMSTIIDKSVEEAFKNYFKTLPTKNKQTVIAVLKSKLGDKDVDASK